jgi:hypothetical protein
MGNPCPKDRPPPECPGMLGWTANDASTHHFKMLLSLELKISVIVQVPLMYLISWTNLVQSSLSGSCTLVVKNAIAVQVSGLAGLVAYNIFRHQVVELHILVLSQLHADLVNLEETIKGCTCLRVAPLQFCLIKISENLVDVAKHGNFDLTTDGILQCHP